VPSAESEELWYRSIEQSAVIDRFSRQAPSAVHFMVFDACRNELNLSSNSKDLDGSKGFVSVNNVRGVLIAYATAENKTASDSGVFARILAEELPKKIEAVAMFRSVQLRARNEMAQEPWLSLSALPEVYLAGSEAFATEIASAPHTDAAHAWDLIAASRSIAVFEAFRKKFGREEPLYDALAAERIDELKKLRRSR
jgi:uncharacterized caspase-like protein